VLNYL